jgi:hypothetical protein
MLNGYKTYLAAAAGAATVAAFFLGFIDASTSNMLLALLGFGGLAALRAAI